MPQARREEIASIIETLFFGDLHPEKALTDAQYRDLARRLADPGPIATEDEVEAFFSRFSDRGEMRLQWRKRAPEADRSWLTKA